MKSKSAAFKDARSSKALIPFLAALRDKFGENAAQEVLDETIRNPDHAMLGGFNSELELSRTQTIMEGAVCCNFRYRKKS